jgi:LAGLIDADG endonuclease
LQSTINKKINKMTNKIENKLDPNWVTGFVDGEGCFHISLARNINSKREWHVQACFNIGLHIKDKDLLLQIKSFFGEIGTILINKNRTLVTYSVRSLDKIIRIIIPHFNKYPLITQKQSDFIIWKMIVELMSKGKHLNEDGLIQIINLKASLNNGLPNRLKISFPEFIKLDKPKVSIPDNIDYNWIAGFFTGEGCFFINISKSNNRKLGYSILLQIIVGQHSRDKLLMNSLISTLGCGIISKRFNQDLITIRITKFEDIYSNIIPLLMQYKIRGTKFLDFQDFCKAAKLVNKRVHLTSEGLEEIRKIKLGMNRGRA